MWAQSIQAPPAPASCSSTNEGPSSTTTSAKAPADLFPRAVAEHDPLEIWERTPGHRRDAGQRPHRCGRDCRGRHHQPARDRHRGWNRHTGEPVYNAVVWQDTRRIASAAVCRTRPRRPDLPTHGAAHYLLFRPQDSLDPGEREGAQARADAGDLLGNVDTWLIWN
ncbi:MAG: hypothetical protein R2838_19605 [Caldilineaceae bacterium]